MEIKPIRKIKSVKQSGVSTDDLLSRPKTFVKQTPKNESQTFELVNRRLLFKGQDVGTLINETLQNNPKELAAIAGALEEFKRQSLKKRKNRFLSFKSSKHREYDENELSIIFALCDAYIKKISDCIKKKYDETKDGMSLSFDENGQLILNGMNIHALIEKCRENPNPKSLVFLKGIRTRLEHVLHNKSNSRNYERIREIILDLFDQIDGIL